MPQRRAAVRRDARGQHDHALPRRAAAVEIRLHAGLNRHARSICIARHLHPLGHELLRALAQMAVFLRKLRRQWEDRVRNALVIRPRIRKASLFQKRDVHILPDAVRVDQRSIHVKNQHCLSVLSFQPEAPREVGCLLGIVDPDALAGVHGIVRGRHLRQPRVRGRSADKELLPREVGRVQRAVNRQRAAALARPVRDVPALRPASAHPRSFRSAAAPSHRAHRPAPAHAAAPPTGLALRLGDKIQAVVHPVDHVDIRMARRPNIAALRAVWR